MLRTHVGNKHDKKGADGDGQSGSISVHCCGMAGQWNTMWVVTDKTQMSMEQNTSEGASIYMLCIM